MLEAVTAYGPLAGAVKDEARARWDALTVFIEPIGLAHQRKGESDCYKPKSRSIAWVSVTFGILWRGSASST